MLKRITIIGAGRAGRALAAALDRAGHNVERLVVRAAKPGAARQTVWSENTRIDSDVVFIATQDAEIGGAATSLARCVGGARPIVYHLSGALSSDVLRQLREIGCAVGSFHPLVSLNGAESGDPFGGAYFCLEGDAAAVDLGSSFVADLGGHAFTVLGEAKPLYHAAAVTACGHLVALVDVALEMLTACGVDRDAAKDVLMPLMFGTLRNIDADDTVEALTGPIARADIGTVASHLEAFPKRVSPNAVEVYLDLAVRSIELARVHADPVRLAELRSRILLAKSEPK
ncbi:MAG TPA: DUF2520 domain-containing protein [Pyrinomonadaceae bacterium]|nr:DUF2520 domain-containing protein [Pyrinomonadaceae bacterium]